MSCKTIATIKVSTSLSVDPALGGINRYPSELLDIGGSQITSHKKKTSRNSESPKPSGTLSNADPLYCVFCVDEAEISLLRSASVID